MNQVDHQIERNQVHHQEQLLELDSIQRDLHRHHRNHEVEINQNKLMLGMILGIGNFLFNKFPSRLVF